MKRFLQNFLVSEVVKFGLVLVLAVVLWKGDYVKMIQGDGGFWDLTIYHTIVTQVVSGTSPYQVSVMQTLGPPSVLIPHVPFSWFSLLWAERLFTSLSLAVVVGVCWWLAHHFHQARRIWWMVFYLIILLSAFPTRLSFITGQLTVLALLPLTAMVLITSPAGKGVAAASLVILKTFFASTLIAYLHQKHWNMWLWSGLFLGLIIALFLPVITPAHYLEYVIHKAPTVVLQPDAIRDLAYYSQSLKTSFSRLGLVEHSIFLWVLLSVMTGFITWRSRQLTSALIWSILISPVLWQHYFVMLFPLIVVFGQWVFRQPDKGWRFIWLLAFALWWVEFPWLHQFSISWWWGTLASHYAISGWLWWFMSLNFPEKAEDTDGLAYTTQT